MSKWIVPKQWDSNVYNNNSRTIELELDILYSCLPRPSPKSGNVSRKIGRWKSGCDGAVTIRIHTYCRFSASAVDVLSESPTTTSSLTHHLMTMLSFWCSRPRFRRHTQDLARYDRRCLPSRPIVTSKHGAEVRGDECKGAKEGDSYGRPSDKSRDGGGDWRVHCTPGTGRYPVFRFFPCLCCQEKESITHIDANNHSETVNLSLVYSNKYYGKV
ncbi:hypothetical protein F4678DRAFT_445984 [Xylaria arbuscula]|nr:hypothetical protein F4678DRAFT_445984 [Xylaria arbuscula]